MMAGEETLTWWKLLRAQSLRQNSSFGMTSKFTNREMPPAISIDEFFSWGQINASSDYFYTLDRLGSVRELTNSSGALQAVYAYDPYGRVTRILETVPADCVFAGFYVHARSGLNLSLRREYNSVIGRWMSRDPLASSETTQGTNLYAYVRNSLFDLIDPLGTAYIGDRGLRVSLRSLGTQDYLTTVGLPDTTCNSAILRSSSKTAECHQVSDSIPRVISTIHRMVIILDLVITTIPL